MYVHVHVIIYTVIVQCSGLHTLCLLAILIFMMLGVLVMSVWYY